MKDVIDASPVSQFPENSGTNPCHAKSETEK